MMKTRFILVMLALPLIAIAFFAYSALPASESKHSLSQEQTADPAYNIQPQTEPIEPLSLTQTPVKLSTDESIPLDTSTDTNPTGTNTQGTIASITQAYQQMQGLMNTCVEKKNQLFDQLVAQNQQLDQLEKQRDRLDDQISRANEKKMVALEKQRDQLDRAIERLNDATTETQENLDEHVSTCQDNLSDLQTEIDELESDLDTQFTELLEFELPN